MEQFCKGMVMENCSPLETRVLLSLAHCSGWTADRIGLAMSEIFGIKLRAEEIWAFYRKWKSKHKDMVPDSGLMQTIINGVGIQLESVGRPLSSTFPPKTVEFTENWWSPENTSLCEGFTAVSRIQSQSWLISQSEGPAYDRLTPIEEPVIAMFGKHLAAVMKDVLERWVHAILLRLGEDKLLRPVKVVGHSNLIILYVAEYQRIYEHMFGMMESERSDTGKLGHDTPAIRSTGCGSILLLTLIISDRLHVIEKLRALERVEIGFKQLEVEDLEHDSKICPICKDEMGVEDPDGFKESPIALVICCGQIIGSGCLKRWVSEQHNEATGDSCPICRYEFPQSFLDKLLDEDQLLSDEDIDAAGNGIINMTEGSDGA